MPRELSVVQSSEDGRFWDGSKWVDQWQWAQLFAAPSFKDSWFACAEECDRIMIQWHS